MGILENFSQFILIHLATPSIGSDIFVARNFFSLKPYTNIFFCLRQNNAKKNIITFLYRPIFREKDTIRFEFFLLYCLSLFVSRRGSKIEININLSLLLYLKLFKITTSLNKANYKVYSKNVNGEIPKSMFCRS